MCEWTAIELATSKLPHTLQHVAVSGTAYGGEAAQTKLLPGSYKKLDRNLKLERNDV
jgi:hypothetical protein